MPPPSGPVPATQESARERLRVPARQSPVALVFLAWRFLRRVGVTNIAVAVVFLLTGTLPVGLLALGLVGATVVAVHSALSWWRFSFHVAGDELVVTKGILAVERLVIPLDRVQGVSIDQKLLHRPLDLVRVGVDTAGATGSEFEIDAIDRPRAEALRRLAADARSATTPPPNSTSGFGSASATGAPPQDEVLLRRSWADLVKVGVTRPPWAGLVVLAPLLAFGDEFQRFGVDTDPERLLERVSTGSVLLDVLLAVVLVVVVTVLGAVLQVGQEVLRSWDLTLTSTPTGLRRTAGLISTTSKSSSIDRVQAITTNDNPVQRRLGISRVVLGVFGANDLDLPGTRPSEVVFLRRLLFGATVPPLLDRAISKWSVFLAVRNTAFLAVLVVGGLASPLGWWALLVLVVVPLQWPIARRRWQVRRWGLGDDRLAEAYGLIGRHTAEIALYKAQTVTVQQSFFERRRGLATVSITTADGHLAVPLIDLELARAVADRVLHAVETDHRKAL